ncbi:type II toxin-antitoxin system VapC family toxin [Ottowia sp. SB7-C50]|uniref:type II toxin-antitoxin system VapC family toxin n=1 Tax=Ottowia sp. SB7-C50 TaxID=3081231 RepID=UPI002954206D|nr:type II toxin-antitoxin system VapC family toxin [Ottowia sp. SB7-C50]WOP14004.1 type II toxin-antitoxin system VapC family toxin [Ottowia sp. SB7-C50]
MYLIDTNVVSELMRCDPHPAVSAWVNALPEPSAPFALSVVTVHEILYGLTRRPKPTALSRFNSMAATNVVLDVTEAIARRAGEIRGFLAARGQVRTQADMLIAATAQAHALTLVTRNVRDFDGCGIAVLNPFER